MSRPLLISVVLLAAAATTSQTAWASCGDYLAGNEETHQVDTRASERQSEPDPTDPPTPHAPRPCDGPQCQSGPAIPVSMTVVEVSPRDPQQVGLTADGVREPRCPALGRRSRDSRLLPTGYRPRVERPPRLRA